jgi:hypothetical protein
MLAFREYDLLSDRRMKSDNPHRLPARLAQTGNAVVTTQIVETLSFHLVRTRLGINHMNC